MTNPPVPPEAARLIGFLDSRGVGFETGSDLLAKPQSAFEVMRRCSGQDPRGLPDRATVARLRQLRAALLSLVIRKASQQAEQWESLNKLATEVSYRFAFSAPGSVSLEQPDASVVGAILQDVATLLQNKRWDRLKICADEACGAAFYDHTRSKTQRWHSFMVCGNKNNVAAHRVRSGTSRPDDVS